MTAPVLVVGIGNRYRRDDAVGLTVARAVGAAGRPSIEVVELDGEPARLVEAWTARDHVIVVDASSSGATPGTVRRIEDLAAEHRAPTRSRSTHSAGVAEAYALARSLDRLPARLEVIAIEGDDFGFGEGLTGAVRLAARRVAAQIIDGA